MSRKKIVALSLAVVLGIAVVSLLAVNIAANIGSESTVIELGIVRYAIDSDAINEYTASLNRLTGKYTFSVKNLETGEVNSASFDTDELVSDPAVLPTSLPAGFPIF